MKVEMLGKPVYVSHVSPVYVSHVSHYMSKALPEVSF